MASLAEIENFLGIELAERRLRPGKKKADKNQYYWFEGLYYIVKLTQDKWMIAEDCRKTRKLLRTYSWHFANGYTKTYFEKSTKNWHQLFLNYEPGLIADHVNNQKFDNRDENLRIVTQKENVKNLSKRSSNVSGKQGVHRWTRKRDGSNYWRGQINNNMSKNIVKLFSIKNLGDAEAFRLAVEWRKQKEQEFGYIGD
jgi:hypothetical protein